MLLLLGSIVTPKLVEVMVMEVETGKLMLDIVVELVVELVMFVPEVVVMLLETDVGVLTMALTLTIVRTGIGGVSLVLVAVSDCTTL